MTDDPDSRLFTSLELFVAGAISTLPEFADRHPTHCLPIARLALDAAADWEPDE